MTGRATGDAFGAAAGVAAIGEATGDASGVAAIGEATGASEGDVIGLVVGPSIGAAPAQIPAT